MTQPKRGEIVHACAHGACYDIRVLDNFVWEPWHWPKDCPALKQETCWKCESLKGMRWIDPSLHCQIHDKPPEPKAEEWPESDWLAVCFHGSRFHEAASAVCDSEVGCGDEDKGRHFVVGHKFKDLQRDRERLRGLLTRVSANMPDTPLCREIEEVLKEGR